MSSAASRVVPRLLSTLRSHAHTPTPTLRSHTCKPMSRNISGFQGMQGLAQPWVIAKNETNEEMEDEGMSLHLEALQKWQEQAQELREMRVLTDDFVRSGMLDHSSEEQVQELLQTLKDEDLLDIRRGWVASSNY
ncbi:hypothetical protein OTU49_000590 [Cherax quadricarinatus]|uniref:Uncharacterized protein n=1 Tax=Cherax quadricarinatus TaxID=27406 RepID=A0AAW0Y3K5_CHEQU